MAQDYISWKERFLLPRISRQNIFFAIPCVLTYLGENMEEAADKLSEMIKNKTHTSDEFKSLVNILKGGVNLSSGDSEVLKICDCLQDLRKNISKKNNFTTAPKPPENQKPKIQGRRRVGSAGSIHSRRGAGSAGKGFLFRGKGQRNLRNSGSSTRSSETGTLRTARTIKPYYSISNIYSDIYEKIKNFELKDIMMFVLVALFSFSESEGLIHHSAMPELMSLTDTPILESKLQLHNHIVEALTKTKKHVPFSIVLLDDLCTLIRRHGSNMAAVSSSFVTLLFPELPGDLEKKTMDKIFFTIVAGSEFIFPFSEGATRDRVHICRMDEFLESEQDIDAKAEQRQQKQQLEAFYRATTEERYLPVVDQLFDLYTLKEINLGIYRKYNYWIPEWHDRVGTYAVADVGESQIVEKVTLETIRRRARYVAHSVDYLKGDTSYDPRLVNLMGAENEIVDEEVDFNERIRTFYIDYWGQHFVTKKKKPKNFYRLNFCFEPLRRVVEMSTRLAVKLEVLNLVREPIKGSIADNIKRANSGSTQPEMTDDRQKLAQSRSRTILLCDIYLESIEGIYHSYSKFFSRINLIIRLIRDEEEKIGTPRNFRMSTKLPRHSMRKDRQASFSTQLGNPPGGQTKQNTRGKLSQRQESQNMSPAPRKLRQGDRDPAQDVLSTNGDGSVTNPKKERGYRTGNSVQKTSTNHVERPSSSLSALIGGSKDKNFLEVFVEMQSEKKYECLHNLDFEEVLKEPTERVSRLIKQFKKVSERLDFNDPAVAKVKLVKARLEEVQKNFENERDIFDRLINKLGIGLDLSGQEQAKPKRRDLSFKSE